MTDRPLPNIDCRVCGRWRPYEMIETIVRKAQGRFEFQVNVNCCADTPQCHERAIVKADAEARRIAYLAQGDTDD